MAGTPAAAVEGRGQDWVGVAAVAGVRGVSSDPVTPAAAVADSPEATVVAVAVWLMAEVGGAPCGRPCLGWGARLAAVAVAAAVLAPQD